MIYFLSIIDVDSLDKVVPLQSSLNRFGFDLTLLTTYNKEIGNHSKIINVSEYLQTQSFSSDDYIFLVDAFDCVMTKHPDEFINWMKSQNIDIFISTETGWGNKPQSVKRYFDYYQSKMNSHNRSICAGALVAKANSLKEFMLDMTSSMSRYCAEIEKDYFETWGNNIPTKLRYSDQYYMAYYLWKIDFVNYQKLSIHLDFKDKCFFTWSQNVKMSINKYVFVHVWALQCDNQFNRWLGLLRMIDILPIPPDFDWKFYLENHQDLILAGLKTEQDAQKHYIKWGKSEQRVYRKTVL